MANLVIGDDQTRSAQHDAEIFKEIFGQETLTAQGAMIATKPDNNTIRIGSGMAVCEGRVFINEIYDDFNIPTGEYGRQITYYLGYRIYREASGDRIEKYIAQNRPEQGSLSAGDNEMFAILYSVTMDGINLGDPVFLAETIGDQKSKSKVVTVVGSTNISPKASAVDHLLFTDDQVRQLVGYDISESHLMSRVTITVQNGHYEAQRAMPIGVERRVPRLEKGEKYTQGFWVRYNSAISSTARVNYVITAKVGD